VRTVSSDWYEQLDESGERPKGFLLYSSHVQIASQRSFDGLILSSLVHRVADDIIVQFLYIGHARKPGPI
jgi:hypothetical protein